MKKKILLVDDSLTVQKVVSLTLDKNLFQVAYAKNRAELTRLLVEQGPDLILVSDQVPDIHAPTFPKEVETWLGRTHNLPAFVLITSQDIKEMKHYQGVLKKPFAPQNLQNLVSALTQRAEAPTKPGASYNDGNREEGEDQAFHKRFNEIFSDESRLVEQTFREDFDEEEPTLLSAKVRPEQRAAVETDLWQQTPTKKETTAMAPSTPMNEGTDLWSTNTSSRTAPAKTAASEVLSADDSMAYKALLHQQVDAKLGATDLAKVVEQALSKILPPIVEKIVKQRIDELLKEQESLADSKI